MTRSALSFCLVLSLAGCATYAPRDLRPGATAEDVRRQLGEPTNRYALPGGSVRLEFARGPFGKHTYMVDLGDGGRVIGWQQVLTEPQFEQVRPGDERDALLLRLGRPSDRRGGGRQGGEVWSYRYDTPLICQWFQVSLDDRGRVTDTGYAPDPMCEVRDFRE